jgi:hypothetical protein
MACEGAEEAGKARYAVVIAGCAMRILKWALWILFLLLAPKLLRKAFRSGKKAANRTRVKCRSRLRRYGARHAVRSCRSDGGRCRCECQRRNKGDRIMNAGQ